ncbi:MAG: hypothetical protein ABEH38_07325, partial [Flavobacteriales bacterium]
ERLRKGVVYTAARLDPNKNPYHASYVLGTIKKGVFFLTAEGELACRVGPDAGLPADFIWQVVPDDQGNVWATTNNGMALIHTGSPFTFAEEGSAFRGGVEDMLRPEAADGGTTPPLFLATRQGIWAWNREEKTFSLTEGATGQCFSLAPYPKEEEKGSPHEVAVLGAAGGDGILKSRVSYGMKAFSQTGTQVFPEQAYELECLPPKAHRKKEGRVIVASRKGVYLLAPHSGPNSSWRKVLSARGYPEP